LSVLLTRKTSLLAAWENPTKQSIKAAITQTLKQYKNSMSLLSADLRTARKTAWSVYKQQVKTCGGTSLVQRVDTSSVTLEQ
jgi:hypothetical protein